MERTVSKIRKVYPDKMLTPEGRRGSGMEFIFPNKEGEEREERKRISYKNSNGKKSGRKYKEKYFHATEGR